MTLEVNKGHWSLYYRKPERNTCIRKKTISLLTRHAAVLHVGLICITAHFLAGKKGKVRRKGGWVMGIGKFKEKGQEKK